MTEIITQLEAAKAQIDQLRKLDTQSIYVLGVLGAKFPLSKELDIASDQIGDCLMIAREYYEGKEA